MRVRAGIGSVVILGMFVAVAAGVHAQRGAAQPAAAATATAHIVRAAQDFLGTLDQAGRAKLQYPFDSPQKSKWSNLPQGVFVREGVRLGDLTPAQHASAMKLVETALSPVGFRKVREIMQADNVFRDSRGTGGGQPGPPPGGRPGVGGPPRAGGPPGRGPAFGADEYFVAFLGTPSTTDTWMLQFGGHHLAINLTLAGSRGTLAPTLTATQPATYTFEGRTVRPLGSENDRAFALVGSLDAAQRAKAVLNYNVADLVLGAGKDGQTVQPEGILASALTAQQQTMLMDLVREWAGIAVDGLAAPRMEEIRSNLSKTFFAWSGRTTSGSVAYFRIQGPTLVIEYAPQGETDHIHTIYRDPTNDYGAAYARR